MEFLQYEFNNAVEGSFNGMLGELVRKLRYGRSRVSAQEYKASLPALFALEKKIQDFQVQIGFPRIPYIQKIISELDVESEVEGKLMDEINSIASALLRGIFQKEFLLAEIDFTFSKSDCYFWFLISGYKDKEHQVDGAFVIIKESIRKACYSNDVVFIDNA